jgi:two-component system OmpR family response regulator
MATLLLIEDNDSLRSVIRRVFLRQGHAVEEARDGREAMAIFARTPIDLVITDLHMAVQEGIETIARVREVSESMPIIVISGSVEISLEDAVLMGANMSFKKPFSIDDLVAAVAVLLGEAHGEPEPPTAS